jgi:alkanesulfonate monooxygenase SsuD/methylene tetrahydromethanopterin reductase-like flavin-dependent oxidoreductase (luciferase family)
VKFGVFTGFGAHTSPEVIAATGRVAEERGFHSLWAPEHVLTFREYESRYPYSADGRIPGGPIGLIDPFDALTFIGAHTTRIRLGTGICLVPQRNPVYTANVEQALLPLVALNVAQLEQSADTLAKLVRAFA